MDIPGTVEEFLITLGRAVIAQKSPQSALTANDEACTKAAETWGAAHRQEIRALKKLTGGNTDKIVDNLRRDNGGVRSFLKAAPPYLDAIFRMGVIERSGGEREDFIDLLLIALTRIAS